MIRTVLSRGALAAALASGACGPVWAAQTCFTAFNGTVHYQFAAKSTAFTTKGTYAIPGVLFGALSNCAGLSFWGIVGTSTNDGTTDVLGFRQETADATACGAVDVTVSLSPSTLTGTLQLYNERTNFGNTDTLKKAACVAPPARAAAVAGRDPFGNGR